VREEHASVSHSVMGNEGQVGGKLRERSELAVTCVDRAPASRL
jgi:hypothetical protein